MNQKIIKIKNRQIGGGSPCFIIAEVGINHNGSFKNALKLIDAAKESGCDAVKFQVFKAENMYSKKAGNIEFNKLVYPIYNRVKEFELPPEWVPELKEYCRKKDIIFFSSVCDEESADFMDKYIDIFKLTSYSITHLPLQEHIAKKGKAVIFSTGGANLDEVKRAYNNISGYNKKIAILQCIAKYPCPLEYANVNVIKKLQRTFPEAIIGYSDHTADPVKVPSAATAVGAKIIEKHITLNKNMPGPDHSFALEPHELKKMVNAIRATEEKIRGRKRIRIDRILLGKEEKKTEKIETYLRNFAFRAIFAGKNIKKGEELTKENICILRKGKFKYGLEPEYYDKIIGKKALRDLEEGKPIRLDGIKKNTVAIIQARLNSERLNKKVLMDIGNKSILELIIHRLKKSKKIDNIIIATSTNKENDRIASLAEKLKIDCFRGSEEDVLERIFNAAKKFKADIVVRITADEPLIDPKIVDRAISGHIEKKSEYTSTTIKRTFPKGVDVEVLNFNCLKKLNSIVKTKYGREHVTSYIHNNKGKFRINSLETKKLKRRYILTVDEIHDLKFIKELFDHFRSDDFYTEEIIKFLDRRISIRVDGSNKGGLGHVYRCLALAKELRKEGFDIQFIMQDLDDVPEKIKEEGFDVVKIKKGLNEREREEEFIEILRIKRTRLVIIDLLKIDYDFSDKIKELGIKIVSLDILGKMRLNPDVIINRSIIEERHKNYNFNLCTKFYLGPRYEILDGDFGNAHRIKRKIHKKVRNVLLTLGGSDPKNLSPRVIEALDNPGLNINVIIGPAYKNTKQIEDMLEKSKGSFKVFYNIKNMARFMLGSDIAITAGGKTLYELAATGTPALICCEVPHQVENAGAFEKRGSVINLGLYPSRKKIREMFVQLSKNHRKRALMSKAGKKIVDGMGLKRVADIIKEEMLQMKL
ncbi:UDP-2,4-diacetamido-2,4,6-trideoxy-beta-L-altropyranose hydrolase [Candidatus Woesearchaeota archaeon]|nr:UDP-2,4-diacetamido-2,4,6-trideoxy-beta-L-altropyranose hydrolase [Candidatus Woesearchaeota archaeon]